MLTLNRRPGVDPRRLARRRIECQLSQRALARAARLSAATIARLEAGDTSVVELAVLQRLANALAVGVGWLLGEGRRDVVGEADDDVTTLIAALVEAQTIGRVELARALGWPLRRLDDALARARADVLPAVGLQLGSRRGVGLLIAADAAALSERQRASLARRRGHASGLTATQARVLWQLLHCDDGGAALMQTASQNTRLAVATLTKRGLIDIAAGGLSISKECASSLAPALPTPASPARPDAPEPPGQRKAQRPR